MGGEKKENTNTPQSPIGLAILVTEETELTQKRITWERKNVYMNIKEATHQEERTN